MKNISISAEIKGIKYQPLLCKNLNTYEISELDYVLNSEKEASFILNFEGKQIALSWWVSPKRTRSYPYARVYDTLCFSGKKATIIPIMKDEGKDGDRDFLQWDTVSLMTLLNVYVIISYYVSASRNPKFKNKITDQNFDTWHIKKELKELISYQSDAFHWNNDQLQKENIDYVFEKAIQSYEKISNKLAVEMHSIDSAKRRKEKLIEGQKIFMNTSRALAEKAQKRESVTIQPKEFIKGNKASITIKNYLGGLYYFTCDEVEIHSDQIYLIEAKHSRQKEMPSLEDIKDGLLRMILYTNLINIKINNNSYKPIPVLKLTTAKDVDVSFLKNSDTINLLLKEAKINGFKVKFNEEFI